MWKQSVAWAGRANTEMSLTREQPLAPANRVALKLKTEEGGGGVTNTGFWGIPVASDKTYALSFYALNQADSTQQVGGLLPAAHSLSLLPGITCVMGCMHALTLPVGLSCR